MLRDLQACIGAGVSMFLAGICLAETTVYQSEAAYLAALNSLGYEVFTEGFEDDPTWGTARSPLSARSIVSRGIVWTSNHPAAVKTPSAVSTAGGQAHSGSYAVFSSPHGDPDVISPTGFMRDGLILKRVVGATKLYGVAGWLSGFAGSRVRLFFDGDEANSVEIGAVISPPHQFFGVIVTTGFLQVEVRETEGTLEDQKFIFADDFTFALKPGEVGTIVSVSSASLAGTSLAPGSILTAFGDGLAVETAQAPAGELPTSLGGTEVRIRDSAGVERIAPLYFVSPAQINYVLPAGTPAGTATVTVLRGGMQAATGSLQVAVVAPGVFTANMDGLGPAAAWARIRPSGGQADVLQLTFQCGAVAGSCTTVPLDLGGTSAEAFLEFYGTGISGRSSLGAVSVTIGGVGVEVLYAGPQGTYTGLDQVNVRLPRSLLGRGEVPVVLVADGVAANTVQISIR